MQTNRSVNFAGCNEDSQPFDQFVSDFDDYSLDERQWLDNRHASDVCNMTGNENNIDLFIRDNENSFSAVSEKSAVKF